MRNPGAHLHILEKIAERKAARKRQVSVTADSVTLGSHDAADVQLTGHQKAFILEIKNDRSGWWLLNPLRNPDVRVNGTKVGLETRLQDQDKIEIDGHEILFEPGSKWERNLPPFIPQPESDESLWRYFLEEAEFDEILINGAKSIFVDWKGILLPAPWTFSHDDFTVQKVHRSTKVEGAWASWRLNRQLRFQAALPPLVEHPHVAIRKAKKFSLKLEDLEKARFGNPEQIDFLRRSLEEKQNILISGGTSTGKTVLLRALVEKTDPKERVVLLEEEAEIDWPHAHLVAIECGRGNLRQAVIESLRMRPNRLVVSEVRGAEAFEMLQAMNTGHSGALSTIHSNSTREAVTRLESLVMSAGTQLSVGSVRRMIANAIHLIVQLDRNAEGERFISGISRINGIQNETLLFSDPLELEPKGIRQRVRLKSEDE